MVKCELCGRELKNTQGLRGHKNFYHKDCSFSNTPDTETAIIRQDNGLEDRLDKLEYITGLREPSVLDKYLYNEKTLPSCQKETAEQLGSITEKIDRLADQIISLINNTPSNTELREIEKQVTQLSQQVSNYGKSIDPIKSFARTVDPLENELNSSVQNTRVNTLENRLSLLEEEVGENEKHINKNIEENKAIADNQIKKVMEVIYHAVERLTNVAKQLEDQLREQKQVTDWVKKEYDLRPVKKLS